MASKEIEELIDNLNMYNHYYAERVFSYEGTLEHVIEKILGAYIRLVVKHHEYRILNPGGRGVVLDYFMSDARHGYINLEIQSYRSGASSRRARYQISLIDGKISRPNQSWDDMEDIITIFITDRDYLGNGQQISVFERMDIQTYKPLNDGTTIIYVNGEIIDDSELGKMLEDFACINPEDMHEGVLKEVCMKIKNSKEGREKMADVLELFVEKERQKVRDSMSEYVEQEKQKVRDSYQDYVEQEKQKVRDSYQDYVEQEKQKVRDSMMENVEKARVEEQRSLIKKLKLAGFTKEKISEITSFSLERINSLLL